MNERNTEEVLELVAPSVVPEQGDVELVPTEVKHFIYDEAGNRVEVPEAEVIGYVQEGEGTVATVTE